MKYRLGEHRVQADPKSWIAPNATLVGKVKLEAGASVWFNCVLRGDVHHIRVGNYTNIQDGTIVHVTNGRFPTIIGDCVTVGHAAVLHGCTIKDRVLVGIGAIVLDNVTVGEESFIAAGALVTPGTVIPPRSMVMGSPAKVRREVTEEEIAQINRHWQNYVEYKAIYQAEFGG